MWDNKKKLGIANLVSVFGIAIVLLIVLLDEKFISPTIRECLSIVICLGLMVTAVLWLRYNHLKEYEIKKKNSPYNFDELEEYKVYCAIRSGKSNIGKYSRWKEYILNKYKQQFEGKEKEDFKRFLIGELRSREREYEILKTIMIPVSLLIVQLELPFVLDAGSLWAVRTILILGFVGWMTMKIIENTTYRLLFRDCIELYSYDGLKDQY